jgi:signal transduction histidine kinase
MIVSNITALMLGTVLVAVATVLSVYVSVTPSLHRLALIVPSLDFLAIGALCVGTGAGASIFSALVVLPVVWFAMERSRINIFFASAGASLALLVQFPFEPQVNSVDVLRNLFTVVMFSLTAFVVNELSRQLLARLESLRELAARRESMLEHSIDFARELSQSEARLRTAERLFRGLWESITEQSVIGTDVTGLIDAWNPGAVRMLGVSAEDAEDKMHMDAFHLADELEDRARELNYPAGATVLNPGFSALVEPARLGSADVREWTYIHANGNHITVELSVTPRLDDSGETIGYLFVAQDVTKAREVARLKDEFVGLISHELRTPISSILGYLELMRDDEDQPLSETQLQYLGVAERNAHRLLRLVGDLLFTAQVESGKFNLDLTEQRLAPLVHASVESARPAATRAGITLIADIADGAEVQVDGVRIGQACDNLISNAIKFTRAGGTVTVSLTEDRTDALISVRDTGMGIPAAELDQLFARFFRATTATRNAIPGVGLGLTITKAIVTAHLGTLDVESEEGVGTTFSLTLPLAPLYVSEFT